MDYEKFYSKNTKTHKNVNFDCVDSNNQVIDNFSFKNFACFSPITYGAVPDKCKKILIYHKLKEIPYATEIISKWVEEINNFGFRCSVNFNKEQAIFTVDLKNFKRKMLVNSTLVLIRALFETGICYVPSYYFAILEANPKFTDIQKFDALQTAHKLVYKEYCPNTNHMVVYNGDSNITLKKLMKNIDDTKIEVYADAYTGLTRLWINY